MVPAVVGCYSMVPVMVGYECTLMIPVMVGC